MQKKICMLGAFGVGKTSLVRRLIDGIFSDTYLTTIGVKIDRYRSRIDKREITLILWDIQGEEDDNPISQAYLKGSSGFVMVADVTSPQTVAVALKLERSLLRSYPNAPIVWALNKADLLDAPLSNEQLASSLGITLDSSQPRLLLQTSARDDKNVKQLFETLAADLLRAAA